MTLPYLSDKKIVMPSREGISNSLWNWLYFEVKKKALDFLDNSFLKNTRDTRIYPLFGNIYLDGVDDPTAVVHATDFWKYEMSVNGAALKTVHMDIPIPANLDIIALGSQPIRIRVLATMTGDITAEMSTVQISVKCRYMFIDDEDNDDEDVVMYFYEDPVSSKIPHSNIHISSPSNVFSAFTGKEYHGAIGDPDTDYYYGGLLKLKIAVSAVSNFTVNTKVYIHAVQITYPCRSIGHFGDFV